MIQLENVSKTFYLQGHRQIIADNINTLFPSGVSVGLLGRNGAGKTSLLRLLAGTMVPDRGRVISSGSISWPVGFGGSFHKELSGAQNTRFTARTYGVDCRELMEFVEDFAGLGKHFHLPLRTYSSGMRSRLAFGVSMGIQFETYLVDEVTAVGDADFKQKSKDVFRERLKNSGAIVVSHSTGLLHSLCQSGAVLEKGKLTYYSDIVDAIEHHKWNMDHP